MFFYCKNGLVLLNIISSILLKYCLFVFEVYIWNRMWNNFLYVVKEIFNVRIFKLSFIFFVLVLCLLYVEVGCVN